MSDEYTSGPESDPTREPAPPGLEGVRMTPPTPPTVRGELSRPARQTAWPTVVGVLMVIFGSLGALGGCIGMAVPLFGQAVLNVVPEDDPSRASVEASFGHPGVTMAIAGVGMAVAVLLLIAGIGVMRRKAWARPAALIWAGVKMISVLVGAIVQYPLQQAAMEAQSDAMANAPNAPPPGVMALVENMVVVGLAFGVIWGWALPVFVLIWFNLKTKKAEIATWT